jgi:hypothetical protein
MDPREVLMSCYFACEEHSSILVEESKENSLSSDALRVVLQVAVSPLHPLIEPNEEVVQLLG